MAPILYFMAIVNSDVYEIYFIAFVDYENHGVDTNS